MKGLKFTRLKKYWMTVLILGFSGFLGCNKTDPNQMQPTTPPQVYSYPPGGPYFPNGTPPINPTFPAPKDPPGQGPDSPGADWGYGGTAAFYPVSSDVMNAYVSTHPLNAPKNIKINVNLVNIANGIFAGQVQIAYDDAGQHYNGYFDSGNSLNSKLNGSSSNGLYEAQYNTWFKYQGNSVFSGFFQDEYGAIVLVIDGSTTGQDAQGVEFLSGSVWYMNFAQSSAVQSPYRKCWYISQGPYDCRSLPVITKTGLYPTDTFTKLGTFKNLPKQKAFNKN